MRKGSYVAALAVAGLVVMGCEGETEVTTPPTGTGDQVQNQVDEATSTLQQEARELGEAASDQAATAGGQLNEQMQQALQNVDAETRQQFQQLQSAIQQQNWDEARSILSQLDAKREQLSEQGQQLLEQMRAQVQAGD